MKEQINKTRDDFKCFGLLLLFGIGFLIRLLWPLLLIILLLTLIF